MPSYTVAGTTLHFIVQYDTSMGAAGLAVANSILGVCEVKFQYLQFLFNSTVTTTPVTVQIEAAASGGFNNLSNFIDISAGPDAYQAQYLLMTELSEIFMIQDGVGWNANPQTNKIGGLSQMIAETNYPVAGDLPNLYAYQTVYLWLNAGRPDWVNQNQPGEDIFISRGCALCFLYYLQSQLNFTLQEIVACNGTTLVQVHQQLTGESNGWQSFSTLVNYTWPKSVQVPFTFLNN